RPRLQRRQGKDGMLDDMEDARPVGLLPVMDEALDPQQARPGRQSEQVEEPAQGFAPDGALADDGKGADAPAMAREGGRLPLFMAAAAPDRLVEGEPAGHVVAERGGRIGARPE